MQAEAQVELLKVGTVDLSHGVAVIHAYPLQCIYLTVIMIESIIDATSYRMAVEIHIQTQL